jgi:sugar phosphate permease
MKSESWIIAELGGALVLLAGLSFFYTPVYEKGAWFVMGAFVAGFNLVLGYKFGKGMPEQAGDAKPGQASQSKTTSETTTQAPAEDVK